jgi:hypothetical protein
MAVVAEESSDEYLTKLMNSLKERDYAVYQRQFGTNVATPEMYAKRFFWHLSDASLEKGEAKTEEAAPVKSEPDKQLISRIEVGFPVPVEISGNWYKEFDKLLGEICSHYEATHPREVMWVFGMGSRMISNPMIDGPLKFDDSVYSVEIACRERFEITEAPTLETIKNRIPGGHDVHTHLDLIELVEEAYALGRRDYTGDQLLKKLASTFRESGMSNLLLLACLLKRAGGEAVISPAEVYEVADAQYDIRRADVHGGWRISIEKSEGDLKKTP